MVIQNALLNNATWLEMFESIRHSAIGDRIAWAERVVEHAPVKLDLNSVSTAIEVREFRFYVYFYV